MFFGQIEKYHESKKKDLKSENFGSARRFDSIRSRGYIDTIFSTTGRVCIECIINGVVKIQAERFCVFLFSTEWRFLELC